MSNDTALVRAFLEGRKSERKAVSNWLREKDYETLSDLVKAGAHVLDADTSKIRAFDEAERRAAIERTKKNG
jgi:hypothetical protein